MSLDYALLLLQQYGYLILFPLAVLEGPIITIVAGLLVAAGILNGFVVYAVVVAGDLVGDTFWYSLGRFGHGKITRALERFFGVTADKIQYAKEKIETRRFRMVALFKLTQGVGFAGLVAAGVARVSFPLFILACFSVTLLQAGAFLTAGFFFGAAYRQIGAYFDYVAVGGFIVGLAAISGFLWYRWHKRKKL